MGFNEFLETFCQKWIEEKYALNFYRVSNSSREVALELQELEFVVIFLVRFKCRIDGTIFGLK